MGRRVSTGPVAGSHVVEAAIHEGKFPESRRAHYLALMAKNPKKTERLIAKLEPVLAPPDEMESVRQYVEQRPQTAPVASAPSGPTDYPKEWVGPISRPGAITFETDGTAIQTGASGPGELL